MNASSSAIAPAFRYSKTPEPSDESFASYAVLQGAKPEANKASDCEWASCSLFNDRDEMLKLKGLRKRHPYIYTMSIPAEYGHHASSRAHVNFWRFAGIDMCTTITSIEEHGL